MILNGFDGRLELSDESELADTDIVAQVMYEPGTMDANELQVGCFEAAFQTCYSSLAGASIPGFETIRIIQDIKHGSTAVWLRLKASPTGLTSYQNYADEMHLKFLARGTLTILGWLDTAAPEMSDLCRAIQALANGTLPVTTPVPTQRDLVRAVAALQVLKTSISNARTVKVLTHRGAADLDMQAPSLDLDMLVRKPLLKSSDGEMILIVEEPDYLRTGKWRLRHGTQHLEVKCDPGAIIDGFYRRTIDIRPGDALHCCVRVNRSYGSDNELLSEQLTIIRILEILSDDLLGTPTAVAVQEDHNEDSGPSAEQNRVLEQVEGAFGVLTLRQIPIN